MHGEDAHGGNARGEDVRGGSASRRTRVWLRNSAAHSRAWATGQRTVCFSMVRCWIKRNCMIIHEEAVGLHFTII
eukprot:365551-Chlamydomonas_euryale.AAC.3